MTQCVERNAVLYFPQTGICFHKIAGQEIQERIIDPVYPPVFFPQFKIVFYLIILGIYPACHFIGHPQEFGPVKAVKAEQEPQGYSLKDQESKKRSVPADKEKYISHRK